MVIGTLTSIVEDVREFFQSSEEEETMWRNLSPENRKKIEKISNITLFSMPVIVGLSVWISIATQNIGIGATFFTVGFVSISAIGYKTVSNLFKEK